MLRKIAVVSVSLLGLIGMSPFVDCTEAEGDNPPSISEMEQFVESAGEQVAVDVDAALDRADAKLQEGKPAVAREILNQLPVDQMTQPQLARAGKLAEEAGADLETREEQISAELQQEVLTEQEREALELEQELALKFRVEREARQARAQELVEEGNYLLYHEAEAEKAYELAARALRLDPANKQAQNLRIAAGLELGKPQEERIFEMEKMARRPSIRQQSARQALENCLADARETYQEGDYQTAIERLRNARLITETLSTYMDVSAERREVENMLEVVQEDYQQYQKGLAADRRQEAAEQAEEMAGKIAEEERRESARRVEEIIDLLEQAEYDRADRTLDDWAVDDPSDELVPRLRKRVSEARHDYKMDRVNAARERGDMWWEVEEGQRETVPEALFNYPDKAFWNEVVEKRQSPLYPSAVIAKELSPEDRAIREELEEVHDWRFQDTPLPEVVEFLMQITDVSFILRREDLPPSQAPVSFVMTTTLENALEHIADLTNMAWKIDRGAIIIGAPESLRDYEQRVYPVLDLLISRQDAMGAQGAGRGGASLGGGASIGGGGGGGGFGGQFGQFDGTSGDAAIPQFGGAGGGGAGGGGQQAQLLVRAQNLRLLIMQICGANSWRSLGTTTTQRGGGAGGGAFGGGGFEGPPAGLFGGAGGFGGMPQPGVQAAPTGATAVPQGDIYVLPNNPGQIIVYQTAEVHECIERLLKDMRASMKVQVYVDFRFLQVNTDFFREVGFRWDNFTLDAGAFSGPYDQLKGMGLSSPNYGGFDPFLTPSVFDTIFLPDPDDPTEGEYQAILSQEYLWLTHPFAEPDWEIDDDTGVITWTKATLPPTAPFMGTGTPFYEQASGLNLDVGFGGDKLNLSGFFRLAHERNAARTLSAPQIMLANGQQGFILNSTEFDYVSTFDVEDNVLVPEIDTVTSTIGLMVRPVVGDDLRYVFLELAPQIADVDLTEKVSFETFVGQPGGTEGGASGASVLNFITLPRITSNTLATTVGVPDRGVVVVGGLSQSNRDHHEHGVPILDRIPLLKRLFSAEGRSIDRNTQFIMVSPDIVILGEEEQRMR